MAKYASGHFIVEFRAFLNSRVHWITILVFSTFKISYASGYWKDSLSSLSAGGKNKKVEVYKSERPSERS